MYGNARCFTELYLYRFHDVNDEYRINDSYHYYADLRLYVFFVG